DASGKSIGGVSVQFASATGKLAATSATTDAAGTASVSWKPDSVSSQQSVTATIGGLSVSFSTLVTTSLARPWVGHGPGIVASMTIQHALNNQSAITGSATITINGATYQAFVTGNSTGPNVGIQYKWTQITLPQSLVFTAQIQNHDSNITGTLVGAGFNGS